MASFDSSVDYDMPSAEALSASLEQHRAEQQRSMQRLATTARKLQQAEFQREAERVAHERELVELQRKADEREAHRDAEQAARVKTETRRFIITTALGVAVLMVTIAGLIIALVTR